MKRWRKYLAITKMKPIYTTLDTDIDYINDVDKMSIKTLEKSIDYIDDKEKNMDSLQDTLVSSFGCNINNAEFDFMLTKQIPKRIKGDYSKVGGNDILAWHIIQSFSPEDNVTPQQVHELGKELAKQFLGEEYQYIVSNHLDKNHLHNHIIFNSTSFKTFKNFDTKVNFKFSKLREISNNICRENNLSTLELPPLNEKYERIKNSKKSLEVDISKKINHLKIYLKMT